MRASQRKKPDFDFENRMLLSRTMPTFSTLTVAFADLRGERTGEKLRPNWRQFFLGLSRVS
jgi:hypothetical protein